MRKLTQGWALFKASVVVLRQNRKLLWFPVISTCLTAMVALFFIIPMFAPFALHPTGHKLTEAAHWTALGHYYFPEDMEKPATERKARRHLSAGDMIRTLTHTGTGRANTDIDASKSPLYQYSALFWIYSAVIYFGSMFLATFFNVAFYSEIMAAFAGQGVSFRRGLTLAATRWRSILMWSLMAGLIGWLIRRIEERLPFVGRIFVGLIGMAWSVACVFVVPVIIQQHSVHNPFAILKKAAATLKQTWGESLAGYVGFAAGNFMILIGSLGFLATGLGVAWLVHSAWVAGIVVVFWLIGLVAMAYVTGVASQLYRCALYIFATEGVVPEPYTKDLLDLAWKVKKQ